MGGAFAVPLLMWGAVIMYAVAESGLALIGHKCLSTIGALKGVEPIPAGQPGCGQSHAGGLGTMGAGMGTVGPTGHVPPDVGLYYRNPFRGFVGLIPGRIDEGVDYGTGGIGHIYALGDGQVVNVFSGWYQDLPFIAYRLGAGPYAGRVVYVAEHVRSLVRIGQRVTARTPVAAMYGGIEIGWANAQGTDAAASPHYSEGQVTAEGINFSELMRALGAPGGSTPIPRAVSA